MSLLGYEMLRNNITGLTPAAKSAVVKEHCKDWYVLTKSYFGPVKMNFFQYIVLKKQSLSSWAIFFLIYLYAYFTDVPIM